MDHKPFSVAMVEAAPGFEAYLREHFSDEAGLSDHGTECPVARYFSRATGREVHVEFGEVYVPDDYDNDDDYPDDNAEAWGLLQGHLLDVADFVDEQSGEGQHPVSGQLVLAVIDHLGGMESA